MGQIIGARVEQGITQAQLAERVGTKQTNISRLECGEGNPTLEFMQKIGHQIAVKDSFFAAPVHLLTNSSYSFNISINK
ncbi:MAG: helix-turn-helix domain-containing protein [Negativicutes bacterium]